MRRIWFSSLNARKCRPSIETPPDPSHEAAYVPGVCTSVAPLGDGLPGGLSPLPLPPGPVGAFVPVVVVPSVAGGPLGSSADVPHAATKEITKAAERSRARMAAHGNPIPRKSTRRDRGRANAASSFDTERRGDAFHRRQLEGREAPVGRRRVHEHRKEFALLVDGEIGRATCRERCVY